MDGEVTNVLVEVYTVLRELLGVFQFSYAS